MDNIMAKMFNYLIDQGYKPKLNEDADEVLFDLDYYFSNIFNDNSSFKFSDENEITEVVDYVLGFDNRVNNLKDLTLFVAHNQEEYLDETVEYILERLSGGWGRNDERGEYLDEFFGWYCEDLESVVKNDTIMNKIGKIIWENIKDENPRDIDRDRYNRFATAFDDEYWIRKLKNDEYIDICEVYEELFKTPEEKLLSHVDKIAGLIDSAGNTNFNQKMIQLQILEHLESIGHHDLLDKILESEELRYWNHTSYEVLKAEKKFKQEDKEDRISVEEAQKIIEENGLQDKLRAVEGYIGMEDMKFDYLIDLKEDRIISEGGTHKYWRNNTEVIEPWIHNRDFGDKKMRKSWFVKIIKEYKND